MLAILIQCGCTDTMQFTPCERRLEQVGRIHRAIAFARADERMHFVDEENHAAGGLLHFVQYRLEAFFELAAEFRAGDQRAHVERKQALALQAFRDITIDYAQRETFGNGRLADAGFADQDRVVFRAARENLHRAADFLVAANDRIKLAVARILGQVAGIFLEGLVALFGIGAVGRAALAKLADCRFQRPGRHAGTLQSLGGRIAGEPRNCQQHAFGRDKRIACFLRAVFCVLEQLCG